MLCTNMTSITLMHQSSGWPWISFDLPNSINAYLNHINVTYSSLIGQLKIAARCKQIVQINDDHYSYVIMSALAPQITGVPIVYSTDCSGIDARKQQSYASLAFVSGIHRRPVKSPHKEPVPWKMFLYDDVIMSALFLTQFKTLLIKILYCQ